MGRSAAAAVLILSLLSSSGCGWTSRSLSSLGFFKEKPVDVCSLSDVREYEEALEAARSSEGQSVQAAREATSELSQAGERKQAAETVVHKFVIRNTSKAPLRIERVISGCGGSVGRYDQSIPSGKEGVITITLNPEGCDEKNMRSAIVVADDPQRPAVLLKHRPARGS